MTVKSNWPLNQTKQSIMAFTPVFCLFPFKLLIQLTFGKRQHLHSVTFMSLCETSQPLSRCLTTVHSQFMPLCHWPEYRIWSLRSIGPLRIRSKISPIPTCQMTHSFILTLHNSNVEFWLLLHKWKSLFSAHCIKKIITTIMTLLALFLPLSLLTGWNCSPSCTTV